MLLIDQFREFQLSISEKSINGKFGKRTYLYIQLGMDFPISYWRVYLLFPLPLKQTNPFIMLTDLVQEFGKGKTGWFVSSMMSMASNGMIAIVGDLNRWELEWLRMEGLLPRWLLHSPVWCLSWDDLKTGPSWDCWPEHLQ